MMSQVVSNVKVGVWSAPMRLTCSDKQQDMSNNEGEDRGHTVCMLWRNHNA